MKGFQRAAAFLLAGVLSFGGGSTAYAEDLPAALPAEATGETQIASEPEIVYINSYDDRLRTHAFNDGWKFYLGEADGAEQQVYDDAS